MRWTAVAMFVSVFLLSIGACSARSFAGAEDDVREITGTVQYNPIEGGFHVIRADDGSVYDPTSLPEEFRKDGLKIAAKVKIRKDVRSIHMVGTVVDVVSIEKR